MFRRNYYLTFQELKGVSKLRGVTSPSEFQMDADSLQLPFQIWKEKGQPCGKKCIGEFCVTCKRRVNKSPKK